MTHAPIAARIVSALETSADREAGAETALVSVTVDVLSGAADSEITTALVRKTRTLVFMSAEARSADGERVCAASSVHKVNGA
jgi:hypothetical protein